METEAGNPSLKCKSSQVIKLIVQVTGHYHSVSLRQIVDADTYLKTFTAENSRPQFKAGEILAVQNLWVQKD